ncbi:hypothetical protein FHR70_003730 [Microvirga lupini]|uniref:Uncharacterized protein n=1 Tax=Microvirga lupini TaxID=420324 RepID=A0A7W4YYT3_9HYPH|nr:hypothetical protein [Microvirga lupini]
MKLKFFFISAIVSLLPACANERIVNRSEWLGQATRSATQNEVFVNLSRSIISPFAIPTRTTISPEIKMQMVDNGSISAAIPIFNVAKASGALGVEVGDNIDTYTASVAAEANPATLRSLRDLYMYAVDPNLRTARGSDFARSFPDRWLFWKNRQGQSVGDVPPPPGAQWIGSSSAHDFYTTNPLAFSEFVLATLGGDSTTQIRQKPPQKDARPSKPPPQQPAPPRSLSPTNVPPPSINPTPPEPQQPLILRDRGRIIFD